MRVLESLKGDSGSGNAVGDHHPASLFGKKNHGLLQDYRYMQPHQIQKGTEKIGGRSKHAYERGSMVN